MHLFLYILFWTTGAAIAYTYLVYPIFILVFGGRKQTLRVNGTAPTPEIEIICAAYNEEKVIEEKIHSTFRSNYPAEKITFTIGTDNCTDGTNAVIRRLQIQYPRLKLVEFTTRTGKIGIINSLCTQALAPVLVLTDANVYFEPETLDRLVAPLSELKTGMVCGNIQKRAVDKNGVTLTELRYMNLENRLKLGESNLLHLVMGAEGGCYAIRRELFSPIPSHFIADDFFITCLVLRKKLNIGFEEMARAHEDVSADTRGEFRRKARIATGNFQNLFYFSDLLIPFTKASFAFWSHKVLRWITPFLFAVHLVVCALLIRHSHAFEYVLAIECGLIILPLALSAGGLRIRPVVALAHFSMMNAALAVGLIRYLKGVKSSTWEPVKR